MYFKSLNFVLTFSDYFIMEILACRRPILVCLLRNCKLIKKYNACGNIQQRNMSHITQRRMNNNPLFRIHNLRLSRNFAIMRILSSVLKLRYLVLGSAVGGGVTVSKVCNAHAPLNV